MSPLIHLRATSAVLESASLARKRNLPERQTLKPTVACRFPSFLYVALFAPIRMFHKPSNSERVLFINTLLQRGVGVWWRDLNRFSGFRQGVETVEIETVLLLRPTQNTR